uniref:3D domain-containing protein n=1 Tax=Bacillus phage Adastra TaxID=3143958 RepID=A0AAU8BD82_9CAUD
MRISHIVLSLLFVCFVCSQISNFLTTKERDKLSEENIEIKDTNQILLEKNTHLTDDLTDAKEKVKDLEKKLKDVRKTSKKVESQVKKLEEDKKTLEQDKKNLEKDKSSLQKQVKELSLKKDSGSTISSKSDKKVASSTPSKKEELSKGRTLTMVATAYTASCAGCSGITTTGIDLRSNPSMKVIAVDPSVIPLGSRVHVEGYGYAIAGDTGGAIKGNKIDIFVPNRQDALAWGVRTVKVTY